MDKTYKFDMNKTGNHIQEMRKAAGYKTQQELADAAGIALNSVSRYEKKDPRTPKVDAFALIANALKSECDADYLLGLQEHPKKTTSEISKLIPLKRDAILALENLKKLANGNEPFTYVDGYGGAMEADASLIAGMIDWFIRGLCWRIDKTSLMECLTELKGACEYSNEYQSNGNKLQGDYRLVQASDMAIQSARYELGRVFGLLAQEFIQDYLKNNSHKEA